MDAKMWPTPAARDLKGANSADHLQNGSGRLHLDRLPNFVAHLWSTPRASDGEKGGPNMSFGAGGEPLPSMAANWMSPRVSRGGWMNQRNGSKKLTMEGQAMAWATPSVADTTGGRMTRSGARSNELLLKGQAEQISAASLSTPPSPETPTAGEPSSPERRSLNPLFVEWLMGWPPGWTSFACSATALFLWKRRMRSALLSLASPREAPPAQLSLAV
ncbi:hypothetical protein [uncultured Pleomorphomonas sp.]|uniref:hypothetical protein n=1 Tax=uncultured Pleomorphomonas sp. TaxID=442121 RepID=UPI00258B5A6D|nr:hypothetical protein [uncultured Pleomorphomonas sp.]